MPGISVSKIPIPFNKGGGINWSSYWATLNDLLLFFGEKSKVTGGKLYNQVTGATDYLDVAGAVGSETFKIPDSYGPELVDNNTFADDSFWSLFEATIGGGVAVYNNLGATRGIYKAGIWEIGKHYLVSYEIKNYVSGSVTIGDNAGTTSKTRNANGVYSEIFTPASTAITIYTGVAGSIFNIDNVYIKEITTAAAYLAADNDLLWYSDDALTNRLVTTDELQRYDWERTIVKYADTTPYAIEWIAILKDGVVLTAAEEISLRNSFHLSIWWDGTLSAYGNLKENRTAEKSDGTELVLGGEFVLADWTAGCAGTQAFGGTCGFDTSEEWGISKTLNPNPFVVGETYRVIYEVSNYVSGTVRFVIGFNGVLGTLRSADGIYIEDIVFATGVAPSRIDMAGGVAGFKGTIDHFSIRNL